MMARHSPVALSLCSLCLFLTQIPPAACHRPIRLSLPISDGIIHPTNYTSETSLNLILLNSAVASCEPTDGFLPCSTTLLGNIFLFLVYGYLMFLAAKQLSAGSEILLEILGPGLVGGFFLPLLSSLPDAAIILASGLSGTKETAQEQVSVGMGLLAGSTVMLLTILWGSCLLVGKCDIEGSMAVDLKDTKGFSLTGCGVSTDKWTSYAARIMVLSVAPLLIVQLPHFFPLISTSFARAAILLSLILSLSLLISYGTYQVFQPWMQRRRLAAIKHKRLISHILQNLGRRALGKLFTQDGHPNIPVLEKLFDIIDYNSDGHMSPMELRAFILGMQLHEEMDIDIDDAVERLMKDFHTAHNSDSVIHKDEFVHRISIWLEQVDRSNTNGSSHHKSPQTPRLLAYYNQRITQEQHLLGLDDDDDRTAESINVDQMAIPKWKTAFKAVAMLLLGSAVAAAFADPLVDAVDNFSTASGIPTFFVSFVILPFASSSEVVSSIISASRKKCKTTSLTYSEIYGSVTMSNILSLAVFLGLVYFRQLSWDFSVEVVAIILVCILMGGIGSFRTTFPLWMALLAFALYPISLFLVYILDNFFGWS